MSRSLTIHLWTATTDKKYTTLKVQRLKALLTSVILLETTFSYIVYIVMMKLDTHFIFIFCRIMPYFYLIFAQKHFYIFRLQMIEILIRFIIFKIRIQNQNAIICEQNFMKLDHRYFANNPPRINMLPTFMFYRNVKV